MKIKMIKTTDGSPDGININTYEKGKKYDIPEDLAGNFIGQNAAVEDKEKEKAPENEEEVLEDLGPQAPENEEKEKAPEDKEKAPENKEETPENKGGKKGSEEDKELEGSEETKEKRKAASQKKKTE